MPCCAAPARRQVGAWRLFLHTTRLARGQTSHQLRGQPPAEKASEASSCLPADIHPGRRGCCKEERGGPSSASVRLVARHLPSLPSPPRPSDAEYASRSSASRQLARSSSCGRRSTTCGPREGKRTRRLPAADDTSDDTSDDASDDASSSLGRICTDQDVVAVAGAAGGRGPGRPRR